ncbi:hypothetical protein COLO4_14556 [Corchorus olitorius]|uniref:Leucine-rich repeat-containing N-terminal plant-type domain-containing protein n=1 Tax=Corchorus olitorius TaxID=93759 RepID=A0A1R3JS54_9ROSI|nr:hypothetical protein COLO4_14556 [Corchorus olitorius]
MSSCLESASFANESDRVALLDFKSRVTQDPHNVMASWNNSLHFCSWFGVTCSPSNGRVVILNLQGQKLVGSIPPSIGILTFLTAINLENNSFHGEIPQQVGRLLRLQHLNLTSNSLGGEIPANLTHCIELRTLALNFNGFIGKIPNQLSSLSKLETLALSANNLTGTIPTWIGNFSSLYRLSLALNNLHGTIPDELGRLKGSIGYIPPDMALPGHVMDIVDQSMFSEENVYKSGSQNREEEYVEEKALTKNKDWQVSSTRMIEECLVLMMKIGLSCAATLPSKRMTMNIVVNKLLDIRGMLR